MPRSVFQSEYPDDSDDSLFDGRLRTMSSSAESSNMLGQLISASKSYKRKRTY